MFARQFEGSQNRHSKPRTPSPWLSGNQDSQSSQDPWDSLGKGFFQGSFGLKGFQDGIPATLRVPFRVLERWLLEVT